MQETLPEEKSVSKGNATLDYPKKAKGAVPKEGSWSGSLPAKEKDHFILQ